MADLTPIWAGPARRPARLRRGRGHSRPVLAAVAGVLAVTGGALLIAPAVGQESLLPEGFGEPAPPQKGPAPTPAPAPSPAPGTAPVPKAAPTPAPAPSDRFVTEAADGAAAAGADAAEAEGEAEPGIIRVDLPAGARRSLARIGPLVPENGGLAPDSFGTRGRYAANLMNAAKGPIASRWASIALRRALLSAIDTPKDVNGADLAAARAGLLLRMGDAIPARMIVQSVDPDRATPRLASAAMETALANADPAGLCPYVNLGLGRTNEADRWRLAAGMCAALSGEAGPAGWAIGQVRRAGKLPAVDIALAERVVGAVATSRRSTTVEWNDANRLTSWRFGLATATAAPVPDRLYGGMTSAMAGWAVSAAMLDPARRLAAASQAAARGALSSGAYVSLVSAVAADASVSGAAGDTATLLRGAHAAASADERLAAMRGLWDAGTSEPARYAAMVLTARAAAALPIGTAVGDDAHRVIGSMLTGGYDRNAMAWVPTVTVGSRAWGLLAVASPRPLAGVNAATVSDFAGDDDSAGGLRTHLLIAGLAGLGRLNNAEASNAARQAGVDLARASRWSRALDGAAGRGEAGMVLLLVAVGMQGRGWDEMPPHHLYHMVRALRSVGLGAEARMLAAEAVTRV